MIEEQTMHQIPVIVSDNIGGLKQGAALIDQLSSDQYSERVGHCFNSSVGQHFRHILDHYDCLIHGLDAGQGDGSRIDYDSRQRDPEIEENPKAGIVKIEEVWALLGQLDADLETGLQVKMDFGIAPSTLVHRRKISG